MPGALIQLSAVGVNDLALTNNPDVTFWRLQHRRHTLFSVESILNVFQGTADFNKKASVVVSRNGDMVHRIWLEISLPSLSNYSITGYTPPSTATTHLKWVNNIAHAIVKSVELSIGGQLVDKHYSEFWDVTSELSEKTEKLPGYNAMVGKFDNWSIEQNSAGATAQTFYLPLTFFHCNATGLSIPLVALVGQDVTLTFEFRHYLECIRYKTSEADVPVNITSVISKSGGQELSVNNMSVYIDYVFLDQDERQYIVDRQHEILFTQLQYLGDSTVPGNSTGTKINLEGLVNPVKELVWFFNAKPHYQPDPVKGNNIFDYDAIIDEGTDDELRDDPFTHARLFLNGADRFSERSSGYFKQVIPYVHHSRMPNKRVFAYTFAQKPEDPIHPSGHCNFSRLSSAHLQLTFPLGMGAGRFKVYALSWNVLRVHSGMAAVVFR